VVGRLVIAIDGKAVRGAKNKQGKAPHLVAALAHGIGAVLGQVAVDAKSNEIPAVRGLLRAFTSLAGAVILVSRWAVWMELRSRVGFGRNALSSWHSLDRLVDVRCPRSRGRKF
jgi:hypothetical protein